MTTTPLPLPLPEPTTLEAVKAQAAIRDAEDDDAVQAVVAAVNAMVRRLPVAGRARGAEAWPADIALGATMLGARLWARRRSPEGVAAFSAEGPLYVQRNDPDIAQLLELGAWSRPLVG